MHEFVLVCFFAKVEMGRDGVLEEVNDQVAEQYQKGRVAAAQFQAGGTTSTSAVASINPAPSATST